MIIFVSGVQMQLLFKELRIQRPPEQARQVHQRVEVLLLAVRQKVSNKTHPDVSHENAHWRKGDLKS